ncbi:hypothetical protein ASD01_29500 [Ensifer sp. Root423]|uniref:hypothetical protein n=1 Tax=Ensifer sp. Root423 TaxID=1736534 RepID=UPI0007123FDB|nr:hypothetical protein [Ensifer sp. Root423]KQX20955.1 hypothetical protein ASD01_29500 [Ensifer sp. Root423]
MPNTPVQAAVEGLPKFQDELPAAIVNRLAHELSRALNDYDLNCHAVIYPSEKMEYCCGFAFDGLGRTANPVVPTGRGSYRRFHDTTLEDILRSYDNCPAEFRDETREEVIAHWRLAEANVNALRARTGLPAEIEPLPSENLEHRIEAAKAELIACLEAKHGGVSAAMHNDRLVCVYVRAPLEAVGYTGPGFYEIEDAKGRRPILWLERHDYKTVPGFYYRAESRWKGRVAYKLRLKPSTFRIIREAGDYAGA